MATTHPTASLSDFLAAPLRAGAPDVHGPLAVYPVFGPPPVLEYVAFADGCARGLVLKELEAGAAVGDLLVVNPTDVTALLYEGEEVLGAQQNRTFDVSVLVPAGMSVRVPVSCVEQGRWDGARHDEAFTPAPQAAYPALRAMKNRAAYARVASGQDARASQPAVWDEVAAKSRRHAVASATGAMHDVFERRRDSLRALVSAIRVRPGQTGALVAIAGRMTVLDHVSRPDAFATLHPALVQGYALDALEVGDGARAAPPSVDEAEAFLADIARARVTQHDGVGLGRDARFAAGRLSGSGLVAGEELVQLTAFGDDGSGVGGAGPPRAGRVRRPSRRR